MTNKLQELIKQGVIYIKKDNSFEVYAGLASDGIEVEIGNVGEESTIEEYLQDYPTPESW